MNDVPYTNRELTLMFDGLHEKIDLVLTKQDYTNGRVRKLYMYLGMIGSALVTVLLLNGSELIGFVKLIM